MKKHISKFFALALIAAAFTTACQRESVETDDTAALSAAQGATETGGTVEDVSDDAELRLAPSGAITGCATITWAQAQGTYPNSVTIDYGTGCTGPNGRTLAGQITIDMTADLMTPGAVRTAHTHDLTVDGNPLEYTRTVTNMGLNEGGQMYWTVEADGARLHSSDGTSCTWSASRIRTLVEGQSTTDDRLDDAFEITGTGSGTGPNGNTFTSTITVPILKRMDCKWPVSGVEQHTVSGGRRAGTRTLDFGDGSCDDQGTITLSDGSTREITLHRPLR